MSRLSLKPGGEPGRWRIDTFGRDTFTGGGKEFTGTISCILDDVPDSDLHDIQRTLTEYFELQEPAKEKQKERTLFKFNLPLWEIGAGVASISLLTSCLWIWIIFHSVPIDQHSISAVCSLPNVQCRIMLRFDETETRVEEQ